jgi:di/tricarboxylate transporter
VSVLGLTPQQLVFFGILIVACGLLITERLRTDVVAILIILSLYVYGILAPEDAFAGFSSEPAIVIASVFVLSAGLHHTGMSEMLGQWIGRLAGKSMARMLAVIMPFVALMSAFTHHVTITAMMLPVTLSLSREREIPASKLLMPLAIGSSVGTTITIIGAPSFLIASQLLKQAGQPGLGVFSVAPIGLALTAAATLYMIVAGRFLLPARQGSQDKGGKFRLDEYATELRVVGDSPFLGKTIPEVEDDPHHHLAVNGWLRAGQRLSPPFGRRKIREGDVLLVQATPEDLVTIKETKGLELEPVAQYEHEVSEAGPKEKGNGQGNGAHEKKEDPQDELVQAVIAPRSFLVGRTLSQIDFKRAYGAVVVGLWRQGQRTGDELARTKLRVGDVLVLEGSEKALSRIADDRDFLMMMPFQGEPLRRRKALLSAAVMLLTILAAALGWLSLGMATLAGATAMVLTRCLTASQAYRAIDQRMYIFIAGAIPLGTAMQRTGSAKLLASWLQAGVAGWSETLVLFALFMVVALIVQFMGSDSATVALFAPVAIALAAGLGKAPQAYVITLAMAAVVAVFTPMSHHNLIIYGPAGYRFFDYTKVGTPLTLVMGGIVAVLAPVTFPG